MDFKINDTKWKIRTVEEAVVNNEVKNDYTLGLTNYNTQEVLLREDQPNIIKTLKHELMHVWMYEYGHNQTENFNCEELCEIVASSNNFINKVVNDYKSFTK